MSVLVRETAKRKLETCLSKGCPAVDKFFALYNSSCGVQAIDHQHPRGEPPKKGDFSITNEEESKHVSSPRKRFPTKKTLGTLSFSARIAY